MKSKLLKNFITFLLPKVIVSGWLLKVRPYKKNHCFLSQRASLLERASRKILFFIALNLMYLALQLIFFGESRSVLSFMLIKLRFYPILRSSSMIEIHFTWYVENAKLFLSQKSQFDLVEKIKIKNARAHHFFNLQRTANKIFFMWPYGQILVELEKN